jgi:hypothetical protein
MSRPDPDLEAALKDAARTAGDPRQGGGPAPSAPPARGGRRTPQWRDAGAEARRAPVRRPAAARSGRVGMFSPRARAEVLNALYALARAEPVRRPLSPPVAPYGGGSGCCCAAIQSAMAWALAAAVTMARGSSCSTASQDCR